MIDTKFLIELLQHNSYSENPAGVNHKLSLIKVFLDGLDLTWEEERDKSGKFGDFVVASTAAKNSDSPRIALIFHIDTVHPDSKHIPVRKDAERIWGPGAHDMQGGIFAGLTAIKQLAAEHGEERLPDIKLVFNTAEERGSPAFQDQFREIASWATHVFVYENGDTAATKAASASFDFCLTYSRKGIFQQRLKLTGPGGHSGDLSQEHERHNAISEAAKLITKLEALADYERETTINVAQILGGSPNTTLAAECELLFDARFRFEDERARLKEAIAGFIANPEDPEIEITDLGYTYDLPSLQPTQKNSDFFTEVQKVAAESGLKLIESPRGGWSDACNLHSYNPELFVLDGLGPRGGGEHTDSEFVEIKSIEKSVQLTKLLINHLKHK